MQIMTKITSRLRPLPVILGIVAFSVGALGAAIAIADIDIQAIATGKYANKVTVAQLQQGKLKPVFLIDVRSPEEYAKDHIAQTPLVPLTQIETGIGVERVKALVKKSVQPNQPEPTVVLYCTKGARSTKAYWMLEGTGLKMAVLSGGITAWRKAVPAGQDKAVLSPIILQAKKLNFDQLPAKTD
ncbi:rhodanese-like domain-containing protein [Coleofasciculus sp. H7-2]|uniref:rhodanese-like domain-containing protein n=1 Tax=Coleofasciculus sp. H7-2 TaxID=3351545 RepID=UPI00366FA67F